MHRTDLVEKGKTIVRQKFIEALPEITKLLSEPTEAALEGRPRRFVRLLFSFVGTVDVSVGKGEAFVNFHRTEVSTGPAE